MCICKRAPINFTVTETIDYSGLFAEVAGYALNRQKKNRRFSLKVKDYVLKVLEACEAGGKQILKLHRTTLRSCNR